MFLGSTYDAKTKVTIAIKKGVFTKNKKNKSINNKQTIKNNLRHFIKFTDIYKFVLGDFL